MHKYLYLTKAQWVDTWVNGGSIPIALASSYLSDIRDGIMTPDENLIHESNIPIPSLQQHGIHIENTRNITITGFISNGIRQPDILHANYYKEDGLILSFCNSFNREIAKRMGKEACVRILNIEKLRKSIDKQIGCKGIMKDCEYTSSHNRNHFLKHESDAWQDEYRMFWRTTRERWVVLPEGTAELVAIFE
ncbi:hypothetical protein U8L64_15885 [Pseudomonas sp. FIP_A4]|uniref:hypothetical protein n=1 Tax=Pseudomonas sp. FIP_A4 TaxID=3070684 RepID=UPI002FD6C211